MWGLQESEPSGAVLGWLKGFRQMLLLTQNDHPQLGDYTRTCGG